MAKEQGENSLIIDKQTFYNDDSGYVIQGRVDNKNISSLKYQDIEIHLSGPGGYQKMAFVDFAGKFKVYVENPGLYKLEVFNLKYYFEPVVVMIKSEKEF